MMSSDKGSELIVKFMDVIEKKITERKYRFDFLKGFASNCKKVFSSLAEDDYPEVDIFRPTNVAPLPVPEPCCIFEGDKKYDLSLSNGV